MIKGNVSFVTCKSLTDVTRTVTQIVTSPTFLFTLYFFECEVSSSICVFVNGLSRNVPDYREIVVNNVVINHFLITLLQYL